MILVSDEQAFVVWNKRCEHNMIINLSSAVVKETVLCSEQISLFWS